MDALLGNFDRHGANWGFIKENNRYTLAPIFDNGSCLFPNLVDESEMMEIIESEEETDKKIEEFVKGVKGNAELMNLVNASTAQMKGKVLNKIKELFN